MLAAPFIDTGVQPPQRKAQWAPLALSALLHAALALVWLGFPAPQANHPAERTMQVDLAPEPSKAARLPAPQDKPQPQTAPEQGAPIPQLEDGILAQRSSTPKLKPDAAPVAAPEPRTDMAPRPKKPEPVTQNERDFVLGQVMRHWAPPRELAAFDKADVRVSVTVRPDGYFAEAYDARRPWNPAEVFDGYNALSPQDIQRRTIDAFYRAIRQSQPLRLPPALQAKAPFPVRLDFRFKDAR